MSQYCPDCGHVMDSRGFCTWCDEEVFILDQYDELDMKHPAEDTMFMQKVEQSKIKVENEKSDRY